jgi:hypothetical protein
MEAYLCSSFLFTLVGVLVFYFFNETVGAKGRFNFKTQHPECRLSMPGVKPHSEAGFSLSGRYNRRYQ